MLLFLYRCSKAQTSRLRVLQKPCDPGNQVLRRLGCSRCTEDHDATRLLASPIVVQPDPDLTNRMFEILYDYPSCSWRFTAICIPPLGRLELSGGMLDQCEAPSNEQRSAAETGVHRMCVAFA